MDDLVLFITQCSGIYCD